MFRIGKKSQQLHVRWGNVVLNSFSVSKGVYPGGVLSTVLFAIYIDEFLFELILLAPTFQPYGLYCVLVSIFWLVMVTDLMPQKLRSSDLEIHPSATVRLQSFFCSSHLHFVHTVAHSWSYSLLQSF